MRRPGNARALTPAMARETARLDRSRRIGWIGGPSAQHKTRSNGRTIGDASFIDDPAVASAFAPIKAQIMSEGGGDAEILAASTAMQATFTSAVTDLGYTGGQAIQAATQLTTAAQTVGGAVAQVNGLISAGKSGDLSAIAQTFGGTLIAAAVAAGAVSAGVGGLVVAGIGLIGEALSSILGGPSSPQYQVCAYTVNFAPTIVIGCVATDGAKYAPGSYLWRSFPKEGVSEDAWWFSISQSGLNQWHGDVWSSPATSAGLAFGIHTGVVNKLPINWAWPDYSPLVLGAGTPDPRIPDFQPGLLAAWKTNAELALNGCNHATDSDLLLHFVRSWNRAHDNSSFIDIAPASFSVGKLETSWAATQIHEIQKLGIDKMGQPPVNYTQADGTLRIYTGARKSTNLNVAAAHVAPRTIIDLKDLSASNLPPRVQAILAKQLAQQAASRAASMTHQPSTTRSATRIVHGAGMSTGEKVTVYGAAGVSALAIYWFGSHHWRWVTPTWVKKLKRRGRNRK